jgi:hypothetical protein
LFKEGFGALGDLQMDNRQAHNLAVYGKVHRWRSVGNAANH